MDQDFLERLALAKRYYRYPVGAGGPWRRLPGVSCWGQRSAWRTGRTASTI